MIELETIQLKQEHSKLCWKLDLLAMNGLWSKNQWREELSTPKRHCFGLFQNEKLIALASGWLIIDELQITAVATHPQHRQKGHGKRIVLRLLDHARDLGAIEATLEVETSNKGGINLYKSCGFLITGHRKKYYSNGNDAIIQRKTLRKRENN